MWDAVKAVPKHVYGGGGGHTKQKDPTLAKLPNQIRGGNSTTESSQWEWVEAPSKCKSTNEWNRKQMFERIRKMQLRKRPVDKSQNQSRKILEINMRYRNIEMKI